MPALRDQAPYGWSRHGRSARAPRRRSTSRALDAWVAVLTFVLCAPLLTRTGYPLARDLVFTPDQPLTPETLGLGSLPPRAVPLDALVWLADLVMDGAVLARIVVPGALLVAGWGAHRLAGDLSGPARLLVAGLTVWNPFVIERLALGQWALLWCYAALWWLLLHARKGSSLGVLLCVALASITPTGGVIAAVTAVVVTRRWQVALGAAVLQLPWVLPALISAASATGDPNGVAAFAARAERPGGAVLSLLGLGGIWDSGSTPGTRAGILGYVGTALVVAVLLLGLRALTERHGKALVAVGVGGFAIAAASSVAGADDVVRWAVETIPGAGLLRDAQKWLLPFTVVVVLCAGEVAERIRLHAVLSAGLAMLVPLLLVPDGVRTTWQTLTPVHYPADFQQVRDALGDGDVAVLPWRSYRRFSWGRPVSVYDPASRWFDNTVVTSDSLQVGPTLLAGESARAREIGRLLERDRPADVLGEAGITWVVVYPDDPAYDELDLEGLVPVHDGKDVALYRVSGQVEAPEPVRGRKFIGSVDLLVLLGVAVAMLRFALRERENP